MLTQQALGEFSGRPEHKCRSWVAWGKKDIYFDHICKVLYTYMHVIFMMWRYLPSYGLMCFSGHCSPKQEELSPRIECSFFQLKGGDLKCIFRLRCKKVFTGYKKKLTNLLFSGWFKWCVMSKCAPLPLLFHFEGSFTCSMFYCTDCWGLP